MNVTARRKSAKRFLLVATACLSTLVGTHPVHAEGRLFVPVYLTSGFVADAGEPTPFVGSVRVSALYGNPSTSRLRYGATLSLDYRNPTSGMAVGPRIDWQFLTIFRDVGLNAAPEWTLGDSFSRPASTLYLRVSQFLHAGVQIGYETHRERVDVMGLIGADLSLFFQTRELGEPH